MLILLALLLFVMAGPFLSPYNPSAQALDSSYNAPSWNHLFGTDYFGRDLLVRVMCGGRISLFVSLLAVALALFIGVPYGLFSGYLGGKVDALASWFLNLFMAFPQFFLMVTLVAILRSSSVWWVVLVVGGLSWMDVARIVRNQTLSLRERDFILAEITIGVSKSRIITRHILPNLLAPVIVTGTLMIGNVILIESALSFIGLGIQPPTPSWGNIINEGRAVLTDAWWICIFPGLAIVCTVLCINLLGDALRDALDPRKA